jgi:hypothetical protein
MLHTGSIALSGHRLIWKTWVLCYLCNQGQETIDHIVAACPFTREVWFYVLQALGRPTPHSSPTTITWWRRLRSSFDGERRAGMDSLFTLVSWQLWSPCSRLSLVSCCRLRSSFQAGAGGLGKDWRKASDPRNRTEGRIDSFQDVACNRKLTTGSGTLVI